MNVRRLVPALALLLAMLFLTPSAAGTAPKTTVKQTTGPINALAMDGARIAYDIGNPRILNGRGNKILVWNTLTGKVTKVSGKLTDQADITSTGSGVRELAIAGKRVSSPPCPEADQPCPGDRPRDMAGLGVLT